jgi:hypothetical protein
MTIYSATLNNTVTLLHAVGTLIHYLANIFDFLYQDWHDPKPLKYTDPNVPVFLLDLYFFFRIWQDRCSFCPQISP